MHTNKGGNPVFFCKLLFCSVRWFWFYHSSCPLSCLFPKTANLPLVGDVPLLFFWSWLQHTLRPHPFDGMSPPTKRQSEFPVTSQLFISVIHSKKNLWSPPCPLLHFSDHFLTCNHGSYDPQRETHFSIFFHSEQKYAKVRVAFSAIDHSILFIETDTGLHSKGTDSLHDIFCEIFAL